MTRLRVVTALLAAVPGTARAADALAPSLRAAIWSGDRLTSARDGIANVEAWARGGYSLTPQLKLRGEAWVGADPVGTGKVGGDVREAMFDWRTPTIRVRAGRQVRSLGRIDRLAPTDVLGAFDYRRLVDDDDDYRLGVAEARIEVAALGGTAQAGWLPEFRANRLPDDLARFGGGVARLSPRRPANQFALRYERFGNHLDWSLSLVRIYDRMPWFALDPGARLRQTFPRLTMLGADFATTVGTFGVRGEAAAYSRDLEGARRFAARIPVAALALGIDRDFPGQWNVNAIALARFNKTGAAVLPGVDDAVARANAAIQFAWRDTALGGAIRVRKGFASDRGSAEVSAAGFGGGGTLLQAKASYAVRDGVRLTLLGQQFAGPEGGFFGRLRANSTVTAGVRVGY